MEINYLIVRDKVKDGMIVVEYIDFEAMIAYPLTKGLAHNFYNELVIKMGVVNSFDIICLIEKQVMRLYVYTVLFYKSMSLYIRAQMFN